MDLITSANVTKVISIATAIYWAIFGAMFWDFHAVEGAGLWNELASGEWRQNGGGWVPVLLLISLCGAAFWVMLASTFVRALKADLRSFSIGKLAKAAWCLSTLPMVLWLVLVLCDSVRQG